jgi:hypothetical protein
MSEISEIQFNSLEMGSTLDANTTRADTAASWFASEVKKTTENRQENIKPVLRLLEGVRSNQQLEEITGANNGLEDGITLCVLLDENIETAIAASAFVVNEYPYVSQLAEIGLWRRRFKSVLSRFTNVSEVYELSQFPISLQEYENVSDFLDRQRVKVQPDHPVIVIGQEMLDDLTSRGFADVIVNKFSNISVVVVGQSHRSLSAHLSGVCNLAEIATDCSLLIGGEPVVDLPGVISNCKEVRGYYLPTYLKMAILVAEKKGFAFVKVRELAAQIVPGHDDEVPCVSSKGNEGVRR